MNKLTKAMLIVTIAALCAVVAWSQEVDNSDSEKQRIFYELQPLEEDPVAYRGMVKQALEGHMGAYGMILTDKAPYPDHGQSHIEALVQLAEQQRILFPEGSDTDRTRPEIWIQPDAFAAALDKTAAAAVFLKEKYDEGNRHLILNALVRFGESCESCHERFRIAAE